LAGVADEELDDPGPEVEPTEVIQDGTDMAFLENLRPRKIPLDDRPGKDDPVELQAVDLYGPRHQVRAETVGDDRRTLNSTYLTDLCVLLEEPLELLAARAGVDELECEEVVVINGLVREIRFVEYGGQVLLPSSPRPDPMHGDDIRRPLLIEI